MPATIKVGRQEARVSGGKWLSADADLAATLQTVSDLEEVPGYAPDADLWHAEQVAAIFAARVVELNDAVEGDLVEVGAPVVY